MADESLIREALAEAERHRRQREKQRSRMVHWSDLEIELAREMLAKLSKANDWDE